MRTRDLLLELIFPSFCVNCQRLGPALCQNCYHSLHLYFAKQQIEEVRQTLGELYFDQVQIMAHFDGGLQKLIKALKYQSGKNLAPLLAKMLWRHLLIPATDLITFIPLHPRKLRARGYNQCQEVALGLGELTGIPVRNLLSKTKHTASQAQVKARGERLQRMQKVFTVREKYRELVAGKKIILLDDILTTGATLNAASQALKEAGALEVNGLILASKMS